MKKNLLILIVFTLAFWFILLINETPKLDIIDNNNLTNERFSMQDYLENEKLCFKFVKEKLSSKSGGIYTNYLDNAKVEELASGYEILSESEGLIMLYHLKKQDKEEFDRHYNLIKNKMLDKTGLVKWRVKEDNYDISISNATVDDLRILRALAYANELWKDKKYYNMIRKISNGLLKYNTYDECLNNYYDMKYEFKAQNIDTSYLDLYTMKILSQINIKWLEIYKKGVTIIDKSYISDDFPLYRKTYDIAEDKYLNAKTINSIDALLVVLHLSEVGLVKRETIDWIKDQIIYNDGIFAEYNIMSGKPVEKVQSTATYAIAARIAKNIGDEKLYKALINKMLTLQVKDESSAIYGAFGDIDTLKVYSFDNLQALLALEF